jgi:hypothetical protein
MFVNVVLSAGAMTLKDQAMSIHDLVSYVRGDDVLLPAIARNLLKTPARKVGFLNSVTRRFYDRMEPEIERMESGIRNEPVPLRNEQPEENLYATETKRNRAPRLPATSSVRIEHMELMNALNREYPNRKLARSGSAGGATRRNPRVRRGSKLKSSHSKKATNKHGTVLRR